MVWRILSNPVTSLCCYGRNRGGVFIQQVLWYQLLWVSVEGISQVTASQVAQNQSVKNLISILSSPVECWCFCEISALMSAAKRLAFSSAAFPLHILFCSFFSSSTDIRNDILHPDMPHIAYTINQMLIHIVKCFTFSENSLGHCSLFLSKKPSLVGSMCWYFFNECAEGENEEKDTFYWYIYWLKISSKMSTLLSGKIINGECRRAWNTGLQLNLHGLLIISSTTVNSMKLTHVWETSQ